MKVEMEWPASKTRQGVALGCRSLTKATTVLRKSTINAHKRTHNCNNMPASLCAACHIPYVNIYTHIYVCLLLLRGVSLFKFKFKYFLLSTFCYVISSCIFTSYFAFFCFFLFFLAAMRNAMPHCHGSDTRG